MAVPALVYVRGSGDVRTDILSALNTQGYDPVVFTSIDEVISLCTSGRPKMLIIDASAGEAEASQRSVELSGAAVLFDVPLVFISRQATRRSNLLKKQFGHFVAIDVPFRMSVLIDRLKDLYPPERLPAETVAAPADEAAPESHPAAHQQEWTKFESDGHVPETPPPSASVRVSARGGSAPAERSVSILERTKIIANRDPAHLVSTYGGEILAGGSDLGAFDDQLLVSAHPNREKVLEAVDEITKRSKWLGLHSRRVAFVSSAIANALNFGPKRDTTMRTVGLLVNYGLDGKKTGLGSYDFFLGSDPAVMTAMSSAFEESARYAREVLQDDACAKIIDAMVQMIRLEPLQELSEIAIDAQTALATELTDRACWKDGSWDPYGAHRALRMLWRGEPYTFDKSVLASMNRIITEAAASRQLLAGFPQVQQEISDTNRREVESATREAEELFAGKEFLSLKLSDLRPGMRLARPIQSFDGKLILQANIFLDQEMIWRLWQLAIIKALVPPIQVVAEFGSARAEA